MSDNPFIVAVAVVAGFLTLGACVGFSTWVATLVFRLSDRFGGLITWMVGFFAVVIPLFLASFALAAWVGASIAKATGA